MSTTPPAHAADLQNLQRIDDRRAAILRGDVYPARYDRITAMPPYRDSVAADLRYLAEQEVAHDRLPAGLLQLFERLAAAPGRWTAVAVRDAIEVSNGLGFRDGDLLVALDFSLALLGDEPARHRMIETALQYNHSSLQRAFTVPFALGLAATQSTGEEREYTAGDFDDILQVGRSRFGDANTARHRVDVARFVARMDVQDAEDDTVDRVLEDRAESFADPGPRSLPLRRPPAPAGMVVVPGLPEGTGARKELYKSWSNVAGKPLPLIGRGDVAAHREALVSQWPHASNLVDVILGDLAPRESARFRPTLIVGSPGSGKSSLCRAIADTVGLPVELVGLGGTSDGSLMGTSAQWHSARESVPLQLVKRSGRANPAMIWDEVEKASPSRHNGSALDALLALLEPDQARAYRDPALEVECDLSMVSHFATANGLEGVPAPLRDRMRVLVMPEPGWQHLGSLTTQIVARIASERGVDARWFSPLAEDEMDLVRGAWPGGSLRQLTRIVTTLVDGRDRIIGRC